ncbi:MAG: NADH-quinone oxidoreductase subunit C [Thermogemmatispora sp.]|uniref:NADH-quinone oxidoreductase subunit C n=1 Tax=Thermogemmatispora sp. TaxID=1968838 RepID=UPI0026047CE6|nr:NADH-quinone oxidoreductase subunit C [Thermogemmatispora sp.]MBX5457848.1 NADH-quinone oxidoreductase subunit C [Thermogemmatispora sp.]
MDIVPRVSPIPSAADYSDELAELTRDLAPLAQITGQPVAPRVMKGNYLGIEVDRAQLVAVCRFLRDQLGFDLLSCISGVDMLDHLETVYHVRSTTRGSLLQVKVRLDAENPEVDSVVSVWPTANWLERETYDLFGIRFTGHPDLRRMLLDDDFEGYPLRKSFHQVPLTVKPPATTQVDPNMAVAGQYQQRGVEHVVQKKFGQGKLERLHPGTPTFGHASHAHEHEEEEGEARSGSTEGQTR